MTAKKSIIVPVQTHFLIATQKQRLDIINSLDENGYDKSTYDHLNDATDIYYYPVSRVANPIAGQAIIELARAAGKVISASSISRWEITNAVITNISDGLSERGLKAHYRLNITPFADDIITATAEDLAEAGYEFRNRKAYPPLKPSGTGGS